MPPRPPPTFHSFPPLTSALLSLFPSLPSFLFFTTGRFSPLFSFQHLLFPMNCLLSPHPLRSPMLSSRFFILSSPLYCPLYLSFSTYSLPLSIPSICSKLFSWCPFSLPSQSSPILLFLSIPFLCPALLFFAFIPFSNRHNSFSLSGVLASCHPLLFSTSLNDFSTLLEPSSQSSPPSCLLHFLCLHFQYLTQCSNFMIQNTYMHFPFLIIIQPRLRHSPLSSLFHLLAPDNGNKHYVTCHGAPTKQR